MEFNEKLQELRKQKGMTQEELASALYVSRTAISKWESGRGYPNIDSLKSIASFFSVTVDQLLSTDQVLIIAEEDNNRREKHFLDLIYALLDLSFAMLFFLPFFAQRAKDGPQSVSLVNLISAQPYLRASYFIVVSLVIVMGALTFALQGCQNAVWLKSKSIISLSLSAIATILFIVSLQPYAAVFAFALLAIKSFFKVKRQ